jgi:peptide/nickel transport system substrate-binding protein
MATQANSRCTPTRRRFLYLSGLAVTGLVATACGGESAAPTATTGAAQPVAAVKPTAAGPQTPAAAPTQYQEAPQFAALVKDGKLPPVEQRLPKQPPVVQPIERVGKYGGTWRMGLLGGSDTALMTRTIGYDYLVRWDPEWNKVVPNVAESFEASPDAKTYTFTLREGLKWSDGQPFTADDILFWYEDIELHKELTPTRGQNPVIVEKVDQHTVRMKFAQPDGLFLQVQATPAGDRWTRYPAHYLKQFHKKHNTTNLDQLVKEAGAKDWVELFRLKGMGIPGTPYNALWQNKDLPTLIAWRVVEPYGGNAQRVVAERNPYYWKVDPQGRQLPYLDRVTYEVFQDREALVLKAANGEIDMQERHIATNQSKAVFADNQQKGNYRFYETVPTLMNATVIQLNLTHKDPSKRQVFQNQDFRVGLSHAINRQEIIDVVYVGQGEPYQVGPRPEAAEFYNEKLAKQYTAFDLKQANAHLDKAFPQKDGEGFRLGPDGKRIAFTMEIATGPGGAEWVDVMNLVARHWRAVGVDMQVKSEDRSLHTTRTDANEHDAMVWNGEGGLQDAILEPRSYFPFSDGSDFAMAWAAWYNPAGVPRTTPEEPPPAAKKQMELYNQLRATGDQGQQEALMKEILQIAQEQFWVIGINLPINGYGLVKSNMKNVPKSMPQAWLYPTPAPTNPFQYFYE